MLFTQQTEHLNSAISGIQNEIDELENKLIQLREEKAEFEAEKQMILTLESAAESALNQVSNFINAAESLQRQDLIAALLTLDEAVEDVTASTGGEGQQFRSHRNRRLYRTENH